MYPRRCTRAIASAALLATTPVIASASPTIVELSADLAYSPYYNDNPGAAALQDAAVSQSAPIRAITMLEHGQIVATYARDDVDVNKPFPVYSVTKSWTSLMIGMLIDDGVLGLDETLGYVFLDKRCINGAVWDQVINASAVQDVTIEELLTMSSGLVNPSWEMEDFADPTDYERENFGGANLTHSLNFLDFDIDNRGKFSYLLSSQILGYVIKERSGLSPMQFAKERILPWIGIDDVMWDENWDGMQHSFTGLHLTQEQMAKFGQLYLQKGAAGESPKLRIVSEEWVIESTSKKADPGFFPGMGYGYLFWRYDAAGLGFGKIYCAQGLGSQLICMHDELDRVAVMQVDLSNDQNTQMLILSLGVIAFSDKTSFEGEASSENNGVGAIDDAHDSDEKEPLSESYETSASSTFSVNAAAAGAAFLTSIGAYFFYDYM